MAVSTNPKTSKLVPVAQIFDYLAIILVIWGLIATVFIPFMRYNASWVWKASASKHNKHAASVPITPADKAQTLNMRPIYRVEAPDTLNGLASKRLGVNTAFSPLSKSFLKGHVSVLLLGMSGDTSMSDHMTDTKNFVPRSFTAKEAQWLASIKQHVSGKNVKLYFVRVNRFGSKGAVLLDSAFLNQCFRQSQHTGCLNGVLMFGRNETIPHKRLDATARWWLMSRIIHVGVLPKEIKSANSTWPVALVFDDKGRLRYNSATDPKEGFVNSLSSSRVTQAVNEVLKGQGAHDGS